MLPGQALEIKNNDPDLYASYVLDTVAGMAAVQAGVTAVFRVTELLLGGILARRKLCFKENCKRYITCYISIALGL